MGDPLFPNLFNAVREKIFRKFEWDNYSLKIDGELLNNLKFADDIVLISDDRKDLQNMVSDLLNDSQKVDLQVNAEKNKYMTNRDTGALYISNMVISNVNKFTYLKYSIVLKRENTFTLGLNAAKNTDYI